MERMFLLLFLVCTLAVVRAGPGPNAPELPLVEQVLNGQWQSEFFLAVGQVSETSARILYASPDSAKRVVQVGVQTDQQLRQTEVTATWEPQVLVLNGLNPDTTYRVRFCAAPARLLLDGSDCHTSARFAKPDDWPRPMSVNSGLAVFRTPSAGSPARVVVTSCDRFLDDGDDGMWSQAVHELQQALDVAPSGQPIGFYRAKAVTKVMIGDQIYADRAIKMILQHPEPLTSAEMRQVVRAAYRVHWGRPAMQAVLRLGGAVTMPDDHDVMNNFDGWMPRSQACAGWPGGCRYAELRARAGLAPDASWGVPPYVKGAKGVEGLAIGRCSPSGANCLGDALRAAWEVYFEFQGQLRSSTHFPSDNISIRDAEGNELMGRTQHWDVGKPREPYVAPSPPPGASVIGTPPKWAKEVPPRPLASAALGEIDPNQPLKAPKSHGVVQFGGGLAGLLVDTRFERAMRWAGRGDAALACDWINQINRHGQEASPVEAGEVAGWVQRCAAAEAAGSLDSQPPLVADGESQRDQPFGPLILAWQTRLAAKPSPWATDPGLPPAVSPQQLGELWGLLSVLEADPTTSEVLAFTSVPLSFMSRALSHAAYFMQRERYSTYPDGNHTASMVAVLRLLERASKVRVVVSGDVHTLTRAVLSPDASIPADLEAAAGAAQDPLQLALDAYDNYSRDLHKQKNPRPGVPAVQAAVEAAQAGDASLPGHKRLPTSLSELASKVLQVITRSPWLGQCNEGCVDDILRSSALLADALPHAERTMAACRQVAGTGRDVPGCLGALWPANGRARSAVRPARLLRIFPVAGVGSAWPQPHENHHAQRQSRLTEVLPARPMRPIEQLTTSGMTEASSPTTDFPLASYYALIRWYSRAVVGPFQMHWGGQDVSPPPQDRAWSLRDMPSYFVWNNFVVLDKSVGAAAKFRAVLRPWRLVSQQMAIILFVSQMYWLAPVGVVAGIGLLCFAWRLFISLDRRRPPIPRGARSGSPVGGNEDHEKVE